MMILMSLNSRPLISDRGQRNIGLELQMPRKPKRSEARRNPTTNPREFISGSKTLRMSMKRGSQYEGGCPTTP